MSGLKVAFVNFWPGFSPETGLLKLLLDAALGAYGVAERVEDADIILTSTFGSAPQSARFPERAIAVIWENHRPGCTAYAYSFSSDFDNHGGRNCRLPFWFTQLRWPNLVTPPRDASPGDPGSDGLVEIDTLMKPRPNATAARDRELFCCFVASHGERHRLFAVEYLKAVGAVDVYGKVSGKPLLESKYSVLPKYRFNLCFENSLFPGYYTEKALQAWVAGCLPIYYADHWFREDFNPRAVVNRVDFRTLAEFAAYVGAIDKTPMHFDTIINEPFLIRRPSLDQAVDFLARTARHIVDTAPRRIFPGTHSNLLR
jgi:hypothetical protein